MIVAIIAKNGDICVCRLVLHRHEFPRLLQEHLRAYPQTPALERLGAALAATGFEWTKASDFVKAVCRWGGYQGVAGRVLKNNSPRSIGATLRNAHDLAGRGRIDEALRDVLGIKGLGVSFASKHLRFLHPDKAVVLDRIISERLGYPRTLDGYREFLNDCDELRKALNASHIPYPGSNGQCWRVSDIEMAIYASLRGL